MSHVLTSADRARFDQNYVLQNLGAGSQIVTSVDSTTAGFKSLVQGSNIGISSDSTSITIALSITAAVNFGGQTIENYLGKFNDQTGTSYTLQASDSGKIVTLSNASAITLTVPSGLPVGFNCTIIQKAAGKATFTASGTTINNVDSFTKTKGQNSIATIISIASNVFVTGGHMEA